MIRVSVGEAVDFVPALNRVMDIKLPVKAAYRLSRIASKLQPELKLYNEARNNVFKELGKPVEGSPETYRVEPENQEVLLARLDELRAETIDLDLDPVSLEMLGDAQLTAGDLFALEKVIA